MAQVQTVLGPVGAARLGRTLMHEHVFVLTSDVQRNYPEEWGDEDARVADAVRRLAELPRHGIGTLVDVTVIGQGCDIARIKRIAGQVPELNIVVATGCYTFDDVPLFFSRRPASTMTDFFVRDLTEGRTWWPSCAAAAWPTGGPDRRDAGAQPGAHPRLGL